MPIDPDEPMRNVYFGFVDPITQSKKWLARDMIGTFTLQESEDSAHLYPLLTKGELEKIAQFGITNFPDWGLFIKQKKLH